MQLLPLYPADGTAIDRFFWVMEALIHAIAERYRVLGVPLVELMLRRVLSARTRVVGLAARIAAGQIYAPRLRAPRPAAARPVASPLAPHPGAPDPVVRHPTRFGWLTHLTGHHVAGRSAHLEQLLATDPALMALVASDPRFGRILRPLLWMLGRIPPACVPPALPRRAHASRPPAASTSEPSGLPALAKARRPPGYGMAPPPRAFLPPFPSERIEKRSVRPAIPGAKSWG